MALESALKKQIVAEYGSTPRATPARPRCRSHCSRSESATSPST